MSTFECEGCHDQGGNWDCMGELEGTGDCNCYNCTGSEACPECGMGGDDDDDDFFGYARPVDVVTPSAAIL